MQPQEDLSTLFKDMTTRMRVLEERYSNMRKNVQVGEQNILKWNRKLITEIKTVNMDIVEIKKGMHEIKENMTLVIKELKDTVKKQEVKVLEKYISLWEPLNYVTHNELERYIKKQTKGL